MEPCTSCGAEPMPRAVFCTSCGARLDLESTPNELRTAPPARDGVAIQAEIEPDAEVPQGDLLQSHTDTPPSRIRDRLSFLSRRRGTWAVLGALVSAVLVGVTVVATDVPEKVTGPDLSDADRGTDAYKDALSFYRADAKASPDLALWEVGNYCERAVGPVKDYALLQWKDGARVTAKEAARLRRIALAACHAAR